MVWTVRTSRWSELIEGPYVGSDCVSANLDSGELWLLDLPAGDQDDAGHRYRGILLGRFTFQASTEEINEAQALAMALNDAEEIATASNGSVDYTRFVATDGDLIGHLLVGSDLAAAWWPSDGEPDLLESQRKAESRQSDDSDFSDIPFPK